MDKKEWIKERIKLLKFKLNVTKEIKKRHETEIKILQEILKKIQ